MQLRLKRVYDAPAPDDDFGVPAAILLGALEA